MKLSKAENIKQCTPYSDILDGIWLRMRKWNAIDQIQLNFKTGKLPLKASPMPKLEKSGYYVDHGNNHRGLF